MTITEQTLCRFCRQCRVDECLGRAERDCQHQSINQRWLDDEFNRSFDIADEFAEMDV